MQIRLSGTVKESVVDGPGIRMVIFTQGCPHLCVGCHNPQTHSFEDGEKHDTTAIIDEYWRHRYLHGLTISGGEPFSQAEACAELATACRAADRNIITYTGYTWEDLLHMSESNPAVRKLLINTDILVDGRFVESQKNLDLPFRGSENQRVIDVAASLSSAAPVTIKWGREAYF